MHAVSCGILSGTMIGSIPASIAASVKCWHFQCPIEEGGAGHSSKPLAAHCERLMSVAPDTKLRGAISFRQITLNNARRLVASNLSAPFSQLAKPTSWSNPHQLTVNHQLVCINSSAFLFHAKLIRRLQSTLGSGENNMRKQWIGRALLATGICLSCFTSAAHATDLKISSTRIDPTVGGMSGTIHFTYRHFGRTSTYTQSASIGRLELKGTSNGLPITLDTYCADIFSVLKPSTFTPGDLGSLDLSAARLDDLITFIENANALVSSTHDRVYSAAAQLGVWEILNETSGTFDVTRGAFYVSGTSLTSHGESSTQLANAWLGDVLNNIWKPIPGAELGVLNSVNNQRQIYVTYAPHEPPAVPEPASWILMISGFGGMGGMLRRDRRTRIGRPAEALT